MVYVCTILGYSLQGLGGSVLSLFFLCQSVGVSKYRDRFEITFITTYQLTIMSFSPVIFHFNLTFTLSIALILWLIYYQIFSKTKLSVDNSVVTYQKQLGTTIVIELMWMLDDVMHFYHNGRLSLIGTTMSALTLQSRTAQ